MARQNGAFDYLRRREITVLSAVGREGCSALWAVLCRAGAEGAPGLTELDAELHRAARGSQCLSAATLSPFAALTSVSRQIKSGSLPADNARPPAQFKSVSNEVMRGCVWGGAPGGRPICADCEHRSSGPCLCSTGGPPRRHIVVDFVAPKTDHKAGPDKSRPTCRGR